MPLRLSQLDPKPPKPARRTIPITCRWHINCTSWKLELTVDELEELLQLQRRGGEVALAESLREQQPREAPGDRVRDEVALQRRQRGPRRRLVGPLRHVRSRHYRRLAVVPG